MIEIHNFESHFPYLAKKAVAYNDIAPGELFIKLEDGNILLYDDEDNTVRLLPSDPNNLTKKECAREFAERLQRIMDREHITQCVLSQRTGIQQSLLSNYLNAITLPTFHNADKIAKALNCSMDDFRYI